MAKYSNRLQGCFCKIEHPLQSLQFEYHFLGLKILHVWLTYRATFQWPYQKKNAILTRSMKIDLVIGLLCKLLQSTELTQRHFLHIIKEALPIRACIIHNFVLRDIFDDFQPLCWTVFYIYETIRNLIYLEIVLSSIVSRRDFVYSDHTSFVHRMMMMMHGKPHEFYELISPHAGTHHVQLGSQWASFWIYAHESSSILHSLLL